MSEEFPLVTIVTPSYNQGQFLERTIQSVLSQDYPRIEYMVIDGGSTDNSTEIIKKYQDKLSFWISEKDRGQSNAINKGWKKGSGVYCSYMNSDDELTPGAVSAAVETFRKNPDAGIVHGDYTFVDEYNNILQVSKGASTDFKHLLVDGQMPAVAQPSSYFRMSLVKEVGYLDESFHLSMDYDLLVRLAKCARVVYVPRTLSLWRMHMNAKSSTLMKKHWHESLRVRMKYKKLYMWKAIYRYLRFRIFHILPDFIQNIFRRKRIDINDKLILNHSQAVL